MSRYVEFTTLGEVSTSITSGSRGWARYYAEDGALFLRMTNLPREGVRMRMGDLAYVRLPSGLAEAERTRVQRGDVLISITAELGKIGLVDNGPTDAFINQHLACVRPDPSIVDSRYLAYCLASPDPRRRFQRLNDAGAKAGLNLKTLGNFRIALPSLDEQRRIAEILATWDAAIEMTRQLLGREQAWLRTLTSKLIAKNDRASSRRLHLADLFTRDKGCSVPTNTVGRGIPYIGAAALGGNGTEHTDAPDALLCVADDVLLLWDGEYAGKVASGLTGAVGSTVMRLRARDAGAVPRYALWHMRAHASSIRAIREGSGIPHMPADFLLWYTLPLPSVHQQSTVARVLDLSESRVLLRERALTAYSRQQTALTQRLFEEGAP
ncbi:MAG: restriction endonuclease subunit S [Thermoleophilia bacterium]